MKGKSIEDFVTTKYNIFLSLIKKQQTTKQNAGAIEALGKKAGKTISTAAYLEAIANLKKGIGNY